MSLEAKLEITVSYGSYAWCSTTEVFYISDEHDEFHSFRHVLVSVKVIMNEKLAKTMHDGHIHMRDHTGSILSSIPCFGGIDTEYAHFLVNEKYFNTHINAEFWLNKKQIYNTVDTIPAMELTGNTCVMCEGIIEHVFERYFCSCGHLYHLNCVLDLLKSSDLVDVRRLDECEMNYCQHNIMHSEFCCMICSKKQMPYLPDSKTMDLLE